MRTLAQGEGRSPGGNAAQGQVSICTSAPVLARQQVVMANFCGSWLSYCFVVGMIVPRCFRNLDHDFMQIIQMVNMHASGHHAYLLFKLFMHTAAQAS